MYCMEVASSALDQVNIVISVACHVLVYVSSFTRGCKRVLIGLSVSNVLLIKAVKPTAVRTGWSRSINLIKRSRKQLELFKLIYVT